MHDDRSPPIEQQVPTATAATSAVRSPQPPREKQVVPQHHITARRTQPTARSAQRPGPLMRGLVPVAGWKAEAPPRRIRCRRRHRRRSVRTGGWRGVRVSGGRCRGPGWARRRRGGLRRRRMHAPARGLGGGPGWTSRCRVRAPRVPDAPAHASMSGQKSGHAHACRSLTAAALAATAHACTGPLKPRSTLCASAVSAQQ